MISADLPAEVVEEPPELIPVSVLHEFAYCPRLAYLMWVQGESGENVDLLDGRFVHRRVDEPSPAEVPTAAESAGESSPAREVIHARSVTLSASREGLIARLDLVDLQAGIALPVEYKRGRVPDVPENAWEADRVQVCAQGLILRENGYLCEGGILYYAESRRRVSVPFDDALVDRTRDLLNQVRRIAKQKISPPPLVDSPKCPRCSLVGICLPDETTLLQSSDRSDSLGEVRRLVPARDDALPLYVQHQGATLGKTREELVIKQSGDVLRQVKLKDVSQVSIFGNVLVTAPALRELVAVGIPICHFSYGGWFHAITSGLPHNNAELRISQFRLADTPSRALAMARRFVHGKIKNCRTMLRRHLAAEERSEIDALARLARRAFRTEDRTTLLGVEGMAARLYFAGFSRIMKPDLPFDFTHRNRRPPRDPVNALLSYLYAVLVKEAVLALLAVGFDPMVGFYHQPRYGRPSLALDIAEEFRPLLVDSVVLTLLNHAEIQAKDFVCRAGAAALTPTGRKAVLGAFERRMETLVTHPLFGYRVSYRRVLAIQARLLARAVLGELDHYPSFCTR